MKHHFSLLFLVTFLSLFINTLFSIPNITELTPFMGPSSGGTVVTITGNGFLGATAVDFGGKPAVSFIVNSDNSIIATSPAHSPEVLFVSVTTLSGTSPPTTDAYFVYQGNGFADIVNNNGNSVSVIDTASNMVVATPAVGQLPAGLAITPDGTKAYISNTGPPSHNTVSVIDSASNTVEATITVGIFPTNIAITPDGTKAYVNNSTGDSVSVIDTTSDMVIATLAVGNDPVGIAITPDGTKVFVTNFLDNSVSVIDTASNMVIATPTVGNNPASIAITPDGTKAYVINQGINFVSVIDTASNTVVATPTVGSLPSGIAITPDGTKAYVTNIFDGSVSVIDTASNMVVTIPAVGTRLTGIAITPDGTKAYVVNNISNGIVSVIDIASNMVVATPAVGEDPTGIAITPDGSKVFVTNISSNSANGIVSVIDTASNMVVATPTVGSQPNFIAIAADQAPLSKFTASIASAGSSSTFDASLSVSPVGTIKNYFWDFGDGTILNTPSPVTSHTYAVSGNYSVTLIVTNSAGTSTLQIFNPSSGPRNSTSLIKNGGPSAILTTMITIPPSPIPMITGLNPNSGSSCGGTPVTINGANFTGVTAVLFGSTPASSFTINSDTSITAVSPPRKAGAVTITIVTSTVIGTSLDQFTYLLPSPPKHLRGSQVANTFATQTDLINILTWTAPSRTCSPIAYRIYRDKALTQLVAVVESNKREHLRFKDHHRKKGETYSYYIVSVDEFGDLSAPAKIVIKG